MQRTKIKTLLKAVTFASAALLTTQATAGFKVVGYFPTWQGDVNTIPYQQVTHINYSFVLPTATGQLQALDGGGSRLSTLVQKAHATNVKVLIAVGGWNNGDDSAFRSLAANSSYRSTFINNLLNFVDQYGLDGVDIDWEYPDGGEVASFKTLMRELGDKLRAKGKILTAAVSAYDGAGSIDADVINSVDFLNLMVYDIGTPHSTYAHAQNALTHWKYNEGLPKDKAVLGVPFYSHTQWVAYKDIIARYGAAAAQSDSAGGLDYNGQPTIRAKAELASAEAGGIMFWEISQDTRDNTSLMKEIWSVVGSKVGSGGGGSSGGGTGDGTTTNGNVCFYEHNNYQGASVCTSANNAGMPSGWNDRISSLKAASGYQVEVYEHGNYGGRKVTLSGNISELGSRNFNDIISSYKLISGSGGGTTSYPNWQAGYNYKTGDIVRYNGSLYVAEHDNPGYDPVISTWFWEPYSGSGAGTGSGNTGGGGGSTGGATAGCAAWAEGKTYNVGTKVSYQGATYKSLVTHTAWVGANWNPAATTTLWSRTSESCQ